MWERLAFYNVRVMAPIYIMQADNPGGLHLTAADKGTIYAWWAAFQSLLPIVTGGYADRFGYKRTLGFALSLMILGYLMIAGLRDLPMLESLGATLGGFGDGFVKLRVESGTLGNVWNWCVEAVGSFFIHSGNYWGFFSGIMMLATGTAFFKPSLQGLIAHNLNKEDSSVGWGIFYWVVNVGAFIGHYLPSILLALSVMLPSFLHAEVNSPGAWRNLFIASAVFTSFNMLSLFMVKDVPSGASKTENALQVLWRTLRDIWEPRLLVWLLIMSCFWLMMYQLWDLQPNFIADWVNSTSMANGLSWLPSILQRVLIEQTPRGPMIPQQVLLSANSLFIIIGVVGVAWLTRRMKTLTAMFFGMLLATVGVLVAGWTMNAWILVLGILFFSLGEMTTGPKKIEYLSLIAPPGKTGLYLGYVNIPVGVGVYAGSKIAGHVYGHYGEKAVLALRYLAEKTPFGAGKGWNGDVTALETVLGVKRTEAMTRLQEVTGLDSVAATQMLWDTYHPQVHVWIPFAAIGVVAAVALWIFGRMARNWKDMDA